MFFMHCQTHYHVFPAQKQFNNTWGTRPIRIEIQRIGQHIKHQIFGKSINDSKNNEGPC